MLQRKQTEWWLVLPEKERAKYQNEEERMRWLEKIRHKKISGNGEIKENQQ